jgi:hypothetical protein
MSQRETPACGHVGPSAARDALVALRNLEHLAKSPKVGHKVMADLLPELSVGLGTLDGYFRAHVDEGGAGETGLLAFAALGRVREAVESMDSRMGAGARLKLERALGEDVPRLEGCVEVCELWLRASAPFETELDVKDALFATFAPAPGETQGTVWVRVPERPLPFVGDSAVLSWVLRALAVQGAPRATFSAEESEDAVLTVRRRTLEAPPADALAMRPRGPMPKVAHPDAIHRIVERSGFELRLDAGEAVLTLAPRRRGPGLASSCPAHE